MSKLITLSEAASIGIHSMVLIAQAPESINVIKIAEKTGSSKHHIAKILQRLVKDDFLNSIRGPYGGFSLKKDASKITLLNIYESIEGPIELTHCPVDNQICPFDKCLMGNVVSKMTAEFKEYLSKSTLDQFISKKKKKK